ncbi:MAG TPA: hypothetical protein VGM88_02150 [Kofleriaceae bacterium]|jgi:hypothetical protein
MRSLFLILALAACDDALDQRLAIVDQPRVLAILSEPAEAKPGDTVAFTAIAGGPDGALDAAPSWSFCIAPKPPTQDAAVSAACTGSGSLVAIGDSAALPTDACTLFGPDVTMADFRPRDPDSTGGYYQPVRADALGAIAFGFPRITCDLPTAPGDVAHDYQLHYVANANPTLDPIALPPLAADTDVTLTASWPAAAAESYLYYDLDSQTLVTRREAMRISWLATGGALAVDATAVAEDDPATSASTTWHTPASGPVTLWFVLRDSRGGVAVQSIATTIP